MGDGIMFDCWKASLAEIVLLEAERDKLQTVLKEAVEDLHTIISMDRKCGLCSLSDSSKCTSCVGKFGIDCKPKWIGLADLEVNADE